jgi:hypothetical protein
MSEFNATTGMTDMEDIEAVTFMQKAIPEDFNAALLIRNMISWTATYDHIVDGDPWTNDQVHDMVQILLYELPSNPFYKRNRDIYLTLIINAIHAWRYAESRPEYRIKVADILSELGCAMLLCSGGFHRLTEHGDKWREIAMNILNSSDREGR